MSDLKHADGEVAVPAIAPAAATWNGIGMSLPRDGSVTMPQTPNGTLVFGYFNLTTENSEGELTLSSGASYFEVIKAPPLQTAPGIVVHNWRAANLTATNTSEKPSISIYISAYGPGVPGQTPTPLTIGKAVTLGTTASTQGPTKPQNMRLRITVSGGATGVFAIVGGPLDAQGTNAKVIAVNYRAGTAPPEGYYAVTSDNSYTLSFNWNGAQVYVVNMSSSGSPLGQVLLQAV
ncbi:MAG TPA: hypothetical protein VFJ16_28585 [Longimicrobium sp.]|nr:hypothetical protein [Longimicrobium sp.]